MPTTCMCGVSCAGRPRPSVGTVVLLGAVFSPTLLLAEPRPQPVAGRSLFSFRRGGSEKMRSGLFSPPSREPNSCVTASWLSPTTTPKSERGSCLRGTTIPCIAVQEDPHPNGWLTARLVVTLGKPCDVLPTFSLLPRPLLQLLEMTALRRIPISDIVPFRMAENHLSLHFVNRNSSLFSFREPVAICSHSESRSRRFTAGNHRARSR